MKKIFIILIPFFLLILSCDKEPIRKSQIVIVYQELLDILNLDCPIADPQGTFFKGKIAGEEVCYQDDADGRLLYFGIKSKFTTPKLLRQPNRKLGNCQIRFFKKLLHSAAFLNGNCSTKFVSVKFRS